MLSSQTTVGNNALTSGFVRTLDANNFSLQNTYVDTPTATNRSRTSSVIATHANGTYTVAGQSQESSISTLGYITNFTGNVKNWSKTVSPISFVSDLQTTSINTFILNGTTSGNSHIIELSGNGNSILKQYNLSGFSSSLNYFTVDSSDNIYYSIGNTTIQNIGKIDSGGNLVWQKQMSGNLQTNAAIQINSLTVANGNIFVSGSANPPNGNISLGSPLAIMSFNANTGNLNWQRKFYQSNINFSTLGTTVKFDNDDVYVASTQVTGKTYGYMIKVPSNGTIPGNGVYAGNLVYQTSNVAISNGNITVSLGNTIVLANAVSTAVTTSNITANTANVYTFNSTRLT